MLHFATKMLKIFSLCDRILNENKENKMLKYIILVLPRISASLQGLRILAEYRCLRIRHICQMTDGPKPEEKGSRRCSQG